MSFFNSSYQGTPPWDIGKPQGEIVSLEKSGAITGAVIDVGCGTGENAIFLAGRGHGVLGIDSAELAIKKAKAKAAERQSKASFKVWDALRIDELGTRFDSGIDCGFFHTLSDEAMVRYQSRLLSAIRPGGRYFILAFSDKEPGWGGPRRLTQNQIRAAFGAGWQVESIVKARFEDTFGRGGAHAWLSTIRRV